MTIEPDITDLPKRLIPTSRAFDYTVFSLMFLAFSLSSTLWLVFKIESGVPAYITPTIAALVMFFTIVSPLVHSSSIDVDVLKNLPIGKRVRFRKTLKGNTRIVDLIFLQYIIISNKDLRRNVEEISAILHHEYAHLYYNDAKIFQLTTIMYLSIIIQVPLFIFAFSISEFTELLDPLKSAVSSQEKFDGILSFNINYIEHQKQKNSMILFSILSTAVLTYLYISSVFNREYNADNFSQKMCGNYIYSVLTKIKNRNEQAKNYSKRYLPINIIKNFISVTTHPSPQNRIIYKVSNFVIYFKNPVDCSILFVFSILFMVTNILFISQYADGPMLDVFKSGNIFTNISEYVYLAIIFVISFIYNISYTSITLQSVEKTKNIKYILYFVFYLVASTVILLFLVEVIGIIHSKSYSNLVNFIENSTILSYSTGTIQFFSTYCSVLILIHYPIRRYFGYYVESITIHIIYSLLTLTIIFLINKYILHIN